MAQALSSISDVSVRDWVTGEAITPAKLEADWRVIKNIVNQIIDYLLENQLNFSSGTPTDKGNGKYWYDAANVLLKLRRSGAWEQVLTEKTARSASAIAGNGSATGTMALGTQSDLNDYSANPAGSARATYTLSGNTMNESEVVLQVDFWGAVVDPVNCYTNISGVLGPGGSLLGSSSTELFIRTFFVRTGTNSGRAVRITRVNRDADGMTALVEKDIVLTGIDWTIDSTILSVIGYITSGTMHAQLSAFY